MCPCSCPSFHVRGLKSRPPSPGYVRCWPRLRSVDYSPHAHPFQAGVYRLPLVQARTHGLLTYPGGLEELDSALGTLLGHLRLCLHHASCDLGCRPLISRTLRILTTLTWHKGLRVCLKVWPPRTCAAPRLSLTGPTTTLRMSCGVPAAPHKVLTFAVLQFASGRSLPLKCSAQTGMGLFVPGALPEHHHALLSSLLDRSNARFVTMLVADGGN